jgi:hypothetical protein
VSASPRSRAECGATRYHYTAEELRWRPLEQVLEDLTCRRLSEILGVDRNVAMMLKRGYRLVALGNKRDAEAYELTDREIGKLRARLEAGG